MLELFIYHPLELGASALLGSILWIFLTTWATNRRKHVDVPVVGPISGQNEKKGISDVDTMELLRRGCQKVCSLDHDAESDHYFGSQRSKEVLCSLL